MLLRNFGLIGLAALVAGGCGKDDEKDEDAAASATEVTAPFLTGNDLQAAASLDDIEETELAEKLADDESVYNNEPDDKEDAQSKCMDALFDQAKAHVAGSKLTIGIEVDPSKCIALGVDAGNTIEYSDGDMKLYLVATCEGADISALDGQPFTKIDELTKDIKCTSSTMLSNLSYSVGFKQTKASDQTVNFTGTLAGSEYNGMADLTPCTATRDGTTRKIGDGCLNVERTTFTNAKQDGKAVDLPMDYSKFKQVGIVSDDDVSTRWYSAGTIEAQLDDWKGTLTYTGAAAAPTYSMTRGTAKKEGTLVEKAAGSLRLRGPTRPFAVWGFSAKR